jgi:carbonic anhydrase/acetyltransferase-like protein (isoleucine patch superfamily)
MRVTLRGDEVVIGSDCYIGHAAIVRGDYGSIRIGAGTAVEENATIHIRPHGESLIGKKVTIGHGAIVHCNRIDDFVVIGMGSILSFDVEIDEWAIVGEGCVVPAGMRVPSGKIIMGVPAKKLPERFSKARKISGCMGNNFTLISPIVTERISKGSGDVLHLREQWRVFSLAYCP